MLSTWQPPQSSTEAPSPIVTTRTVSPYFSPKSAIAPRERASAIGTISLVTGRSASTQRLASSSIASISGWPSAVGLEKSNRIRSGATSDPACRT